MFYNKKIEVVRFNNPYTDGGLYYKGTEEVIKKKDVDIQPITQESANKIFGYQDKVTFRVFADPDPIFDTGTVFKYKDKYYWIVKMLPWDSYFDMLADDYKG